MKKPKNTPFFNIAFTSSPLGEVIDWVEKAINSQKRIFIATPNPEIVYDSNFNPLLLEAIGNADINLPDGIGISLGIFLKSGKWVKRIPGRMFMLSLLQLANKRGYRVFFLGSTPNVIDKVLLNAKSKYPGVQAKGYSGPILDITGIPVDSRNTTMNKTAIDKINAFRPHFLFVAFGAPKQEVWINSNLSKLNASCVMAVGGSLDYFSEAALLPPVFLSKLGLEWLYRLIREPKKRRGRIFKAVVLYPVLYIRRYILKSLRIH